MDQHQPLFELLFKQKLDNTESKSLLKKTTQQFPYFSAAQFFLLNQTDKNDETYKDQIAKTSLFFNNHFWLNFQLLSTNNKTQQIPIQLVAETISKDEIPAVDLPQHLSFIPATETIVDEPKPILPIVPKEETNEENEILTPENSINGEEKQHIVEVENERIELVEEVEAMAEKEAVVVETKEENAISTEANIIVEKEDKQLFSKNDITITESVEKKEGITDINESPNEMIEAVEETASTAMILQASSHIEVPINISVAEKEQKEELLFEPLHASDYFASQGIKLSEEVKTADKLGQQLKSFTAWLKTMKKVHPETALDNNSSDESSIRLLAEKSNASQEVITESMAAVFIQQGKPEKAIEVFEKLSLLNPPKSAFFTAQIQNLKS